MQTAYPFVSSDMAALVFLILYDKFSPENQNLHIYHKIT